MKSRLRFRQDGSFTIVQFTDTHFKTMDELDFKTKALMEAVLREEKPDLVIHTGDIIESKKCLNGPVEAFAAAAKVMEDHGAPWAAVFGNHDRERRVTGEELMQVMLECPHCLTEPGPKELPGLGNYVLRIEDSEGRGTAAALYLLDSHEYGAKPVEGYDWIKREQMEWYAQQSADLEREEGRKVPSLAFFHIPLPEYDTVWNERPCYGQKLEKVCSPLINSGFYTAMVERGDIVGTFAGHDHVNDYWGELFGIRLCYGRATGYNTYPREGESRGARVIRLTEGSREFDTWIRLDDGSVIQHPAEHLPPTK